MTEEQTIEAMAKAIWNARESRFPKFAQRKPDAIDEATGAWQNCVEEARAAYAIARKAVVEECAKIVEDNDECFSSAYNPPRFLQPRVDTANRVGMAYAAAIRALAKETTDGK